MVRLNKIYTRKGDSGETSLTGGKRVKKHDLRVRAFGAVDEANAAIGLARLHAKGADDEALVRIQNDLFDLGADLSTPHGGKGEALRVLDFQVAWLEGEIDRMNEKLFPLKSFVLPGGTAASAYLHLARTIVRRAERNVAALMEREKVNPSALKYLNRLSDYLFVLARFLNRKGTGDVLWAPGKSRKA
ncbi:MAG TPA: cob(I)yrinic acid a,c-diamide adenosyltransferase [Sphingomonadales bacterium]|nr:cob(I)yrinic acid a,c-diamide adenosyltransferase [Sphingomonadales bacterium]